MATATPTPAQSLIKVPFPYSPINTSALPFMIAKDAKIFEKHGLDVDLIFMGDSALKAYTSANSLNGTRILRSQRYLLSPTKLLVKTPLKTATPIAAWSTPR